MPALLHRREVSLPTMWGWLAILAFMGGAVLLIGRSLGDWLCVTEPVPAAHGGLARVLVVEGWLLGPELDAAAAYARARGYTHVVTSGPPIDEPFSTFANYAERAAAVLRPQLPGISVDAAPVLSTKANRTYAGAVRVRELLRQHAVPIDAIDVYSVGAHARRTRLLYAMAFGERTQVGVVAGTPYNADPQRWWTSSEAAKSVMGETISLLWTACCFWPPPAGLRDELLVAPPATAPAASGP